MEPTIAENRYVLTKSLFYEGMGRVMQQTYGKTANRAVLGLLAAWAVLAAATLILKQSPVYLAVEAVVLSLAALWIKAYLPRYKARSAWKKLEAAYGADMERTTCFYTDRLTVHAADREVTVAYEEIAQKLSSEHLLILVSTDKTGILVKRDSFTKGSEAEIMARISS